MMSPDRAAAIAVAAESFVRAHADLEALAAEIGPDAAATSDLNDRVVALHRDLESLVLGGTVVLGRRSSPVAGPTIAFYQCAEPGCDGRLEVVHAHSGDAQVDLSQWSIVDIGAVAASRTQMALRAIEAAAIELHWARVTLDGSPRLYCTRHSRDTTCARCRVADCVCLGGHRLDRVLVPRDDLD